MGKYKKRLIFISLSMSISTQLLNMEKLITALFFLEKKKLYCKSKDSACSKHHILTQISILTLSAEIYIYPAECKYESYNICTLYKYLSCAMIHLMHVTLYVM